ncbi:MAG: hypothetical protein ACRDL3_08295 [Solirubrobacterales bacterium]
MAVAEQEAQFQEIASIELSIEKTRARAERAAQALRDRGAEPHLVDALEQAQEELSDLARRLRQSTYFAVPSAQTSL